MTAYYQEDRSLLERCLASVHRQNVAVEHIVVADGYPQAWIDAEKVRHIKLDRSHADYGGTPRGVGALLAIAEDFDAIGFLDADNWLEPDHVEAVVALARSQKDRCDYVIARRNMMRPDETVLPIEDEPIERHVDTNCFMFFAGAFHALHMFALVPGRLSSIGDRVFYANLRAQDLRSVAMTQKTVNYHCLWASLYNAAGEAPPPGAKANIDHTIPAAWLAALTPEQMIHVRRRTGLAFGQVELPRKQAGSDASQVSRPRAPGTINSFDVFDTLVARRCGEPRVIFEEVGTRIGNADFAVWRTEAEAALNGTDYTIDDIYDRLAETHPLVREQRDQIQRLEIDREIANAIPIEENLAKVADGDLLVSDMYLTTETVRRILVKGGLKRLIGLHVETRGKSSGIIWPRLACDHRIASHLGDNQHSDVAVPRQFAIRTEHTASAGFNIIEQTLVQAGLRELALLCREARLATWNDDPRLRSLQLFQVSLNLPFLFLASISLARRVSALGKTQIAFCSRDCNLWLPLFERVADQMNVEVDARYFLTSRLARKKGSEAYLDYARDFLAPHSLVVDLCGTGWSLAHLADRLGVSRFDLFLVDHLPPFDLYERAAKTPATCTVHTLFPTKRVGNNVVLEVANLADHAMLVDMKKAGRGFLPQFASTTFTADEERAAAVQRHAFQKAVEIMDAHDLSRLLAFDDESIQFLCKALYQYMSRQIGDLDIFAGSFKSEDEAAMRQLVS